MAKNCDLCGCLLLFPESNERGRCNDCQAINPKIEPQAGHPGFMALIDEMKALHCKKAADYGRGADPFANVRASAEFGIPAWVGVAVRMGDKFHRIKSFIANGTLANESLRDSLMDLAAYSLIATVLYDEEQAAGKAGA